MEYIISSLTIIGLTIIIIMYLANLINYNKKVFAIRLEDNRIIWYVGYQCRYFNSRDYIRVYFPSLRRVKRCIPINRSTYEIID